MTVFVSVKKTSKGDVLLRIDVPGIPVSLIARWIVETLIILFTFITSQYYVILIGLGIGLGMSMSTTVLNNPLSAQANPTGISEKIDSLTRVAQVGVAPISLAVSKDVSSPVTSLDTWQDLRWAVSTKIYHSKDSALLHQSGQMVFFIGMRNSLYPDFSQFELGKTSTIYGENGGVYTVESIEIRQVSALDLSIIFSTSETYADKVLFVYKTPGVTTQFTVVLAAKR